MRIATQRSVEVRERVEDPPKPRRHTPSTITAPYSIHYNAAYIMMVRVSAIACQDNSRPPHSAGV